MLVKVIILTIIFKSGSGLTSQQFPFPTQTACESAKVRWQNKLGYTSSTQVGLVDCDEGYMLVNK